jgi:hypothetical protein
VNRKPSPDELAQAMRVVRQAFPDLEPVCGGTGRRRTTRSPSACATGGLGITPTSSESGQSTSPPLTVADVRDMVSRANDVRAKRRTKQRWVGRAKPAVRPAWYGPWRALLAGVPLHSFARTKFTGQPPLT